MNVECLLVFALTNIDAYDGAESNIISSVVRPESVLYAAYL